MSINSGGLRPVTKLLFWFFHNFVARKRRPDQAIGRGTVYLYRWWLFGSQATPDGARHPRRIAGRCVYLHMFMRSDDDVMHDHPWDWWSWLLINGYREQRMECASANLDDYNMGGASAMEVKVIRAQGTAEVTRTYNAGSIVQGGAETAHRVQLLPNPTPNHYLPDNRLYDLPWMSHQEAFNAITNSEIPVFSLFFMGPWKRDWGFHCPKGWRHWRDFTKGPHGDDVGAGCGEMS